MLAFCCLLAISASLALQSTCEEEQCSVEFSFETTTHRFDLTRDPDGAFSELEYSDMKLYSSNNPKEWAFVTFSNGELLHGVFSTSEHGILEMNGRDLVAISGVEDGSDEELDKLSEVLHSRNLDSKQVLPFFPNCYAGDSSTHVLSITVVMDWSAAGSNRKAALARLSSSMAVGRAVFIEQLNIRLEVANVVFGKQGDAFPLGRGGSVCGNAIVEFKELGKWLQTHKQNSAFTLLVSDCFSGVTGDTNLGSACGSHGYGSSKFNFLTMFHELGHALGMSHTFHNGVRSTGGLMDYGNGVYDGVVQYHPVNRAHVCPFLSHMKSRGCAHFKLAQQGSSCGDGLLSAREECECMDRSSSCGVCQKCSLTKRVACSASRFVIRTPSMRRKSLVVTNQLLSEAKCCRGNKFAPPKTNCGPGLLDACGAKGECVRLCTRWMEVNNPNCGFDASGCNMGCVFQSKCRFDLKGITSAPISRLPDGSACVVSGRRFGTCASGECKGNNEEPSPTSYPVKVRGPTPYPTRGRRANTKFPTRRRMGGRTKFPTRRRRGLVEE